ncbi:cold-shock protein [Jeotgalibacillus soli]|uniref:CSD domain-containing protein n=1 Tax=Jeotgalibacillus soli TaxID=889306 RepID=A0A0C2VN88_9BACL|nr:cold shock domain-containing protein [Jeotgalibacillus soli]KIL45468.1 hypothetical protein KP78_30120 [Jeotgalibacillus soli]
MTEASSIKLQGRVKYYNDEKGFGFIQDKNSLDYFFHISDVKADNPIVKNAQVDFEPIEEARGNKAINVTIIASSRPSSKSKPKFITINNERILLSKIKKYTIDSHTLHYRNHKPVPKPPKGSSLLKRLFFSPDETVLYSRKTFDYLHIYMFDGTYYNIYSDPEAKRIYEIRIGQNHINLQYDENSWPRRELNNRHNKVAKSGNFMISNNLEYSSEPILEIVNKLDSVFNSL